SPTTRSSAYLYSCSTDLSRRRPPASGSPARPVTTLPTRSRGETGLARPDRLPRRRCLHRSGSAGLRVPRGLPSAVAGGVPRADLGDPLIGQAEQLGGVPH